ncbi:rod-determining factor RdfA [Halobacterium wangiae]|uniref:rod-determining factor RdfA n=1 Tax=Halobacterium wangiae TaxID=2902623 RepID=UPI001E2916F3|nr:rod-determining factor RdfA [Halobacterium wangiae]
MARVIDEYGLDDLGDELEGRWTATGDDHWSLRDLATHLNEELVRERLHDAGTNPSTADVESALRALTDDETGAAEQTQLRRRLQRAGVDVESLAGDLVTYQAVRSYLQDYRDASYEPDATDPVDAATATIQKLRGRLVSVTESKLEGLRKTSRLTLGEFRVIVDLHVLCTECNSQQNVTSLLAAGGCECEETD